MDLPILEIEDLVKYFPVRGAALFSRRGKGLVKAVDGISLSMAQGETMGLVGESGCGKSTLGRLILKLLEPTYGRILFTGGDLKGMEGKRLRKFRRQVQAVFQDPYGSLNPRMRVGEIVGEPLKVNRLASGKEREEKVCILLEKVGLSPEHARRFPHEFSGGQRQRIAIARALSMAPSFVVLDEPVSALDVSIRAQILNLLSDLQEEMRLTYLFISHDLSVVEHISHRISVMYLGKMVESSEKRELFEEPKHPYTQALLSSVPIADPRSSWRQIVLEGELATPINPPTGCRFHNRCPRRMEICKRDAPPMISLGGEHLVACFLYG